MGKKLSKFFFTPQPLKSVVFNILFPFTLCFGLPLLGVVLSFIFPPLGPILLSSSIIIPVMVGNLVSPHSLGDLVGIAFTFLSNTFVFLLVLQGFFYVLIGIFFALKRKKKYFNFLQRGVLLFIALILWFLILGLLPQFFGLFELRGEPLRIPSSI